VWDLSWNLLFDTKIPRNTWIIRITAPQGGEVEVVVVVLVVRVVVVVVVVVVVALLVTKL